MVEDSRGSYVLRSIENQPFYAIAFLTSSHIVHYGTLRKLVNACVQMLGHGGIRQGDCVGLTFAHPLSHIVVSLALYKMGADQVVLPLFSALDRGAKRAVVKTIVTDQDQLPVGVALLKLDWSALRVRMQKGESEQAMISQPGCLLNIGSGTTGEPKIIRLTADEFEQQVARERLARPIQPGERFLSVPLLDFMIAKRASYACLAAGGTVVFNDANKPVEEVCDRFAVDHVLMVVIQAQRLLDSISRYQASSSIRLPRLQSLTVRSSPVSEQLREKLRQRVTSNLWVAYGTNEFGTASVAFPDDQLADAGSVGRVLPGVKAQVVDDEGNPLSANAVGHLRLRAAGMFGGYQDQPDETALALKDGWFYPKDLASITDDGVLIFKGRSDDMIIFEGGNITPREIEAALEQHSNVIEAVAFSLPSEVHGDVPLAAAVTSQPLSEKELIDHCRRKIGGNAPLRILFYNELPRNPAGKVVKNQIKNDALAQMKR